MRRGAAHSTRETTYERMAPVAGGTDAPCARTTDNTASNAAVTAFIVQVNQSQQRVAATLNIERVAATLKNITSSI